MKQISTIALFFLLCGFTNAELVGVNKKHMHATKGFGAWSICESLFDYIIDFLEHDQILLELGSGWTSGEFSKHISVYSIEHDARWINKYDSNYIYAPIDKAGWYNTEILKNELPSDYHLILVDGPTGKIGRHGFLKNISLFNTNVPIILDDVHRDAEYQLMLDIAQELNRSYEIHTCSCGKQFGLIGLEKK